VAIDYTVKAIPTMYRWRLYRSRLEAKWAAFFDALKWTHEYEPLDLNGWSPDFLISEDESRCWAEVKPITDFDQGIATKMEVGLRGLVNGQTTWRDHLLLLGTSPVRHPRGGVQLGWWTALLESKFLQWQEAFLAVAPAAHGGFQPDIVIADRTRWLTVLGGQKGKSPEEELTKYLDCRQDDILCCWNRASNFVQWLPRDET
jgi:hypothetical protein